MESVALEYIIEELACLISKGFIEKVNEEVKEDLLEIVKALKLDGYIVWTKLGAQLIVLSKLEVE